MSAKDDVILGAWAELFVAHALALKAIEKSMKGRSPLSFAEYDVLLAIARSPGKRVRLAMLAETAVYTKSGITRIMQRFEAAGFVRRVSCEDDRRGSYAVLSPSGDRVLKDSWRYYRQAILESFGSGLSITEAGTLRALLRKIADGMSLSNLVRIHKKRPRKGRQDPASAES